MKYTEKISNKLNELLEKNYDAEKRYLILVNTVENKKLKQFFKERAEEKDTFVKELKIEILSHSKITKEAISSGNVYRG